VPPTQSATQQQPGTVPSSSFGLLRRVDAGVLNVGYAEAGPPEGPAVLLLHGWPYDIHTYADVAPLLQAEGYRVVIPYLRGYGMTRFLSDGTFRNAEPAALALDAVALLDALEIEHAILAGCDWGARTADIVAALWPERCNGLVSVSGYLIGSQEANKLPLPPEAELQWWYQYYFANRTRPGRLREVLPRLREAHLADSLTEMELRRRNVRAKRSVLRQTRITSTSSSTTIAGGWVWPKGRRNTTTSRGSSPKARRSPCRRSRSKVTPTARFIRTPVPMRTNSRASTRTGRSRAASDTTSHQEAPEAFAQAVIDVDAY